MSDTQNRWVAQLKPTASSSVESLLSLPLGLDVWERQADGLVVAASEAQLAELERRRLARVERLYTVAEFLTRAQRRDPSQQS